MCFRIHTGHVISQLHISPSDNGAISASMEHTPLLLLKREESLLQSEHFALLQHPLLALPLGENH